MPEGALTLFTACDALCGSGIVNDVTYVGHTKKFITNELYYSA